MTYLHLGLYICSIYYKSLSHQARTAGHHTGQMSYYHRFCAIPLSYHVLKEIQASFQISQKPLIYIFLPLSLYHPGKGIRFGVWLYQPYGNPYCFHNKPQHSVAYLPQASIHETTLPPYDGIFHQEGFSFRNTLWYILTRQFPVLPSKTLQSPMDTFSISLLRKE